MRAEQEIITGGGKKTQGLEVKQSGTSRETETWNIYERGTKSHDLDEQYGDAPAKVGIWCQFKNPFAAWNDTVHCSVEVSIWTHTTRTWFLTWAEFRPAHWSDLSYLFTGSNLKLFDWLTFQTLIRHYRESAETWWTCSHVACGWPSQRVVA